MNESDLTMEVYRRKSWDTQSAIAAALTITHNPTGERVTVHTRSAAKSLSDLKTTALQRLNRRLEKRNV